jgi:hypothetical protein
MGGHHHRALQLAGGLSRHRSTTRLWPWEDSFCSSSSLGSCMLTSGSKVRKATSIHQLGLTMMRIPSWPMPRIRVQKLAFST